MCQTTNEVKLPTHGLDALSARRRCAVYGIIDKPECRNIVERFTDAESPSDVDLDRSPADASIAPHSVAAVAQVSSKFGFLADRLLVEHRVELFVKLG